MTKVALPMAGAAPQGAASAPASRAKPLVLYALDRPKLVAFSNELRVALQDDDADALGRTLELSDAFAARLKGPDAPALVTWFLRSEADKDAAPLFASLRRIAKKRALEVAWTSPHSSLEGRLRLYDVIREDAEIAVRIDKLLSPSRLPWFLVRSGATCGWLDGAGRRQLAADLDRLRAALPPEIVEFASALGDIEGDVVAHDML